MRGRITLIILFFLGLCLSAWLNVQQHTQGVQDKKVLRDKLADLKNQAQQHPIDTPTPSADPTDAPLLAGQSRVGISIYDASIVVVDPISDLVYGEVNWTGGKAAAFTTESLLAKYPECKAGALGTLVRAKSSPPPTPSKTPDSSRTPVPTRTPTNQPFSKYLNGYTYSYRPPAFTCADDKAGLDTVAAAVAALKNQALPTITLQKPTPTPSNP